ncbi:hypothetical protein [Dankookia sp. P2]|uniref:hypothetical protein n=1 Tax=Dankookia sp. P2 TaxID=3423955 RepID=UPI003D67FB7C
MSDETIGTGAEATPGQLVTVHYTGWLFDAAAPETKGRNSTVRATATTPSSSSWGPAM